MAMPTKAQIFENWMDWLNKKGFDWGEPCCWACKRPSGLNYDLNNPKAKREDIINNWNRVPLQRCHIIARQFGGEDIPSNLFLMCKNCHDRSPNTKSREVFLEWAEKQDYTSLLLENFVRELRSFGLADRIEEVNKFLQNRGEVKNLFGNSGLHMNQDRGGVEITISSIIALISAKLKKS